MTFKRTSIALALVSAVSTIAAGTAPAHAITLMDIIRGGPGREPARDGLSGVRTYQQAAEPRDIDPQPLPKVAGPKYNVYKPDATRAVKTAGFAAAGATGPERFLVDAEVSAPADIATALEAFYGKNSTLLWVAAGDISDKARDVLALFERAGDYGLDPAD